MGLKRLLVIAAPHAILLLIVGLSWQSSHQSFAVFPGGNGKIVFTMGSLSGGYIRVMNPDGSGVVQLAAGSDPAWTADGSRIAFGSGCSLGCASQVTLMNADGSGQTPLTGTTILHASSPAWSPDGARLLFVNTWAPQISNIFVMNADGSNLSTLTATTLSADLSAAATPPFDLPVASTVDFPDGEGFFTIDGEQFQYRPKTATTLHVISRVTTTPADHSAGAIVVPTSLHDRDPQWSPDGSKIAFSRIPDLYTGADIYIMNSDGTGKTSLTSGASGATDSSPDWSPDGSKIAFDRNVAGNTDIYVMNADGSGQTRLTTAQDIERRPVWSPDGSQIAFSSSAGPGSDIHLMNADGSGESALPGQSTQTELVTDWQPLTIDSDGDLLTDALEVQVFGSSPFSQDSDADGCLDSAEIGSNPPSQGGGRNPASFWDFYDTPGSTNARDKVITATGDILAVARRFGANDAGGTAPINRTSDPLAGPPPPVPAYHPAFDRGARIGPDPWDTGPPDGVITAVLDILSVARQFAHSCL